MTIVSSGTEVSAPLTPGKDDRNEWATHIAHFGQGGLKVVGSISERSEIPAPRRYRSLCLIVDKTSSHQNIVFSYWSGLKADGSDGDWIDVDFSQFITSGLTFVKGDGSTVSGIQILGLNGLELTGNSKDGFTLSVKSSAASDGSGMFNWQMLADKSETGKATTMLLEPGLIAYDDPDIEGAVRIGLKHGMWEPAKAPNYLAYMNDSEYVIEKHSNEKSIDAKIWFNDVVCPAGSYIVIDKKTKSFGIQEPDELDPNVTGGTDYLLCFRVSMKGVAPQDGFVRAFLMENSEYGEPSKYLVDNNGNPLVVEKHYKAGDKLNYLDIMSIVKAKGLTKFSCHVVDNFSQPIELNGRDKGATGLMIQALKKEEKTGMSLQQFEIDTAQKIIFSSHFFGTYLASLDWIVAKDFELAEGGKGEGKTTFNGWSFYVIEPVLTGVKNAKLIIKDNQKGDLCDFCFGKVFSAEKTILLKNKMIKVTLEITNKDSAFKVSLFKWKGKPGEFTNKIFESRNNGEPVLDKNWSIVDTLFIDEDAVNENRTLSKDFTVPSDASNFAIAIYPNDSQSPLNLELSKLQIDAVNPFNGYVINAPELNSELHLKLSDRHKVFAQDNQGNGGLRYTINKSATAMPIGVPVSGLADVSLDEKHNVITGSSASGGEGALTFGVSGSATIKTELLLCSDQPKGSSSVVKFWFSLLGPDGSETKIPNSEAVFNVTGGAFGAQYSMPTFNIKVSENDKIILSSSTDKNDGAYIESVSPSKPMVKISIDFKELMPTLESY